MSPVRLSQVLNWSVCGAALVAHVTLGLGLVLSAIQIAFVIGLTAGQFIWQTEPNSTIAARRERARS